MAWFEGIQETRLLVAPDLTDTQDYSGEFLSLRHPKTGDKTCYLYTNGVIQELHWFKQAYGSWFLGDYVTEDGGLYTATPVDPVFIFLPIFEEARMRKGDDLGKFRQLDEIIYINGYPGYQLLSSIAETSMQVVCDVQEHGSIKFFRLNESKVLAWLTYKVHALKRTLPTLDQNYATRGDKDTLADAVSILGEYLKEEPWLNLICTKLKVNLQEAPKAVNAEILPAAAAIENSPSFFNPVQEKNGMERKVTRSSSRVNKKAKVETDSRNIKDMFSRASRKGK